MNMAKLMNWVPAPTILTIDVELLSNVISRIGTGHFDIALLHFINQLSPVPISEVCGYVYTENTTPAAAGWCGVRGDTMKRSEAYISNYYSKDPILNDCPPPADKDTNYVRSFSANMIKDQEYKDIFFDKPGFKTELALVRQEKQGLNIAKFYLVEGDLSEETILQIGQIAALVYPLGKRHALDANNNLNIEARPKALDRLNLLIENRFPQLSDRERQVCALAILGNSTKVIADMLEVSPNTIITYRQRAYDRLGVNNANSLLKELI